MRNVFVAFVALVASIVPARASPACHTLAEARVAYPGKHLTYRLVGGAHCWADHGQAMRRPFLVRGLAPAPRHSVLWPVLAGAAPPEAAALYQGEPITQYPLLLDADALTAGAIDASGNGAAEEDYCCWPALEPSFAERWYAMPSSWFLAAVGEHLK